MFAHYTGVASPRISYTEAANISTLLMFTDAFLRESAPLSSITIPIDASYCHLISSARLQRGSASLYLPLLPYSTARLFRVAAQRLALVVPVVLSDLGLDGP